MLGTFAVGVNPIGIAFDGSNMWVANSNSASPSVTKLQASDGAVLETITVGINPFQSPQQVVFDGTSIWVTSSLGNLVSGLSIY